MTTPTWLADEMSIYAWAAWAELVRCPAEHNDMTGYQRMTECDGCIETSDQMLALIEHTLDRAVLAGGVPALGGASA